jgi:hypothetical protein
MGEHNLMRVMEDGGDREQGHASIFGFGLLIMAIRHYFSPYQFLRCDIPFETVSEDNAYDILEFFNV